MTKKMSNKRPIRGGGAAWVVTISSAAAIMNSRLVLARTRPITDCHVVESGSLRTIRRPSCRSSSMMATSTAAAIAPMSKASRFAPNHASALLSRVMEQA
jgi:hypothetical protein